MLLKPDCIPCIFNMALSTMRKLKLSSDLTEALTTEILNLPMLRNHIWDVTNHQEIAEKAILIITNKIQNQDPFYDLKIQQNQMIMNIYPWLQKMVSDSKDPLFTAVKLAALGNAIDVMVSENTTDLEAMILQKLNSTIGEKEYHLFLNKLRNSRFILYFADNSGEIVFDKLLIETIKTLYDAEIVVVVCSQPMLNDATLEEAAFVGLNDMVEVVGNGVDGPLPGTILQRCSKDIRDLVQRADFIISKGGANFDTLDEERKRLNMDISFMFLAKCFPYCLMFAKEKDQPILANYFQAPKTIQPSAPSF